MRVTKGSPVEKKVVINKCFGGFGLSLPAIEAYLARKDKKAFFYVEKWALDIIDEKEKVGFDRTMMKVNSKWKKISTVCCHIYTKDFGDKMSEADSDKRSEYYFSEHDIPRDDPDLIAVVEKLGKKADGRFAELAVVEIPDVEYTIEEYDGSEHIAEKHRTWR